MWFSDLWMGLRFLITVCAMGSGVVASLGGLLFGALEVATTPRGSGVQTVPGVVVRLDVRKSSSSRAQIYSPVVRFVAEGREREFIGGQGTTRPPWAIGQSVQVRYDPQAPDRTALVGWDMWRTPVQLTVAGALALGTGIVLWRRLWWQRPALWPLVKG